MATILPRIEQVSYYKYGGLGRLVAFVAEATGGNAR
jgi:hypothetical protein